MELELTSGKWSCISCKHLETSMFDYPCNECSRLLVGKCLKDHWEEK